MTRLSEIDRNRMQPEEGCDLGLACIPGRHG
jgi:hypothetical protein